jgi:hypothetical protein
VNASTWNLCRSFAGRMLPDPARRSLISRPARRVCCAVKAHRSRDAVRGCALLATDSRALTLTCRSPYLSTVRGRGHTRSTQYPLTGSDHSVRRLWRLPGNPSHSLCTCYTIRRLPCATGGRMTAPQSSTLRDVPFRLYDSLCAVKVVRPCRPDASTVTALAPPPALFVWLHAGAITAERFLRHEGL